MRFENTGKELHHAIMFPIIKGKTIEDVEKAFASQKGPPPVDFEKGLNTQVIDGGIAQNIELDLEAGSTTPSSASSKIARAVCRTSPRG